MDIIASMTGIAVKCSRQEVLPYQNLACGIITKYTPQPFTGGWPATEKSIYIDNWSTLNIYNQLRT
jgi:hypothetical protein